MGVNISCRQGIAVASPCCRQSSAKRPRRNDAIVNNPADYRAADKDSTNSSVDRIPATTAEMLKPEEAVPDQSGFLTSLPTKTDGFPLPQTPPDIQGEEGFMNIHELYNAMNAGYRSRPYIHDPYYMLILDTRNVQEFSTSHILTARKHTAIDTDFDCLINMGTLLRYTMIILYDETGTCNNETIEYLLTRIGSTCEVYVLTEGFHKFKSVYPFLCTNQLFQSEKHRKQISTYPSVVLEGCLFQGNMSQAASKKILQDIRVTHIVNVTSEMQNLFPDEFVYLRIAVEDELSSNLRPRLSQAADFVADSIRHGGRVMVHCVQGVSRSSTITLSFLMKYLGWPLKEARDYLKICRPIINPNRTFIMQLSAFEKEIFGEQLSDADDVWLN